MEQLIAKSKIKISEAPDKFKRYLYKKINKAERLIAIKGARGTGKTTLLLQLAKEMEKELYVALDDLFFTKNSLYSLASEFYKMGGNILLLDEVHKYPDWSREIKLIYDDFSDLKVILTSSSVLDIYKGESDLSRRLISYTLNELSFREYLEFKGKIKLQPFSLSEILEHHEEISLKIIKELKPFEFFSDYLKFGSYPYYENKKEEYYQKLRNTVNLILDVDLHTVENIDYNNIAKMKRLLYVIATNVPFMPNISKLSENLQMNRNSLVQTLQLLNKAELIHTLFKQTKSISVLNKPDKIWLHNTNLNYALSDSFVDVGNIRETFFLQNLSAIINVTLPETGDFLVDHKFTFEIGGKNKNKKQIMNISNAYLVKDDIEIGFKNTIPLWLFGFLY